MRHFFLIIAAAFLYHNLLTPGIFTSHDGTMHVARLAQFTQALKDGHIPVRWLDHWYFGYGYPTFVYNYSLPYYVGALFHFATGFHFEVVYKILLASSVGLSGVSNFLFLKVYFSPRNALFGAFTFMIAPYRFANLYERGALGDSMSLIFIPLLFLVPHKLKQGRFLWIIYGGLILFAFITTHALMLLLFLPLVVSYSIFILRKQPVQLVWYGSSVLLGFFLAAYQWIPMVFEQRFIEIDTAYLSIYQGHLLPLSHLLRLPWIGTPGTGIQVGAIQTIFLVTGLALAVSSFVMQRKTLVIPLAVGLVSVAMIFLMSTQSRFIWDHNPYLKMLLFPWRMLAFTTFAASFLAAFSLTSVRVPRFIFLLLLVLTLLPSRHFLTAHGWHHKDISYYQTYHDPNKLDVHLLPKDAPHNITKVPAAIASVLDGKGTVTLLNRDAARMDVTVNLSTDSLVKFPILSFPGWKVYRQREELPLQSSGTITARMPAGVYDVTVVFTETTTRGMANFITLVSFLSLMPLARFMKLHKLTTMVQ